MIESTAKILTEARKKKYAIGAFEVWSLESIQVVIKAAEFFNVPVILQIGPLEAAYAGIKDLSFVALELAKRSCVPVALHLDHGDSFELAMEAIHCGFTSVMIDASAKAFQENINITREIVKAAHACQVDVEGELGYLMRFFPASSSLSEKIAAALNAEGIICTTRGKNAPPDWHIYSYMYPLLHKSSSDGSGCPFSCPTYLKDGGKATYASGDCPVADDLFGRVINMPLNQWYTAGDCRKIANGINKVLSVYCTEDVDGESWL